MKSAKSQRQEEVGRDSVGLSRIESYCDKAKPQAKETGDGRKKQ